MSEVIDTPGVPELNDEWIAVRTQHLIEEVTAPSPRRRRRIVLTSAGGGAVAVAALLVGILGPWASPAFAGWSADPTTPSSSQLSAAETACSNLATNLASVSNSPDLATLAPIALSDARGPYSLIVYGTTNPSLCVAGSNLTSLNENGGAMSIGDSAAGGAGSVANGSGQSISSISSSNRSSNTSTPPPGGAVVNLSYVDTQEGQTFTVAEGSVGTEVSGATLLLSDGSSVVSTVDNGLFAAWWPGRATVSSIQVTTTAGVN